MKACHTKPPIAFFLKAQRFFATLILLALAPTHAPAQSIYAQAYTFSTFAGYAEMGSADGVGTLAQFNGPQSVAVDTNGNIFVADTGNHTIRKINPAGVVTTIAGFPGSPGSADGTNAAARFNQPAALAFDGTGNLFVADSENSVIREISPEGTDWIVTTIAGSAGVPGTNDGIGASARFFLPRGIFVDGSNNIYVVDDSSALLEFRLTIIIDATPAVRKLSLIGTNWQVSTFYAESGFRSFGNQGPIFGIVGDAAGNLYLPQTSGTTGFPPGIPDGPPEGQIAELSSGPTNIITTSIAGSTDSGFADGAGTNASFGFPEGLAIDESGNLYVSDFYFHEIRKVIGTGTNRLVSTIAGSAGNPGIGDGVGTNAYFNKPEGLALDAQTNLYVADTGNHAIRQITPAGVVITLAGALDSQGSSNGAGISAKFNLPHAAVADRLGNIYIADYGNNTVRKITPAGDVTTLAGAPGQQGSADGIGDQARFWGPIALAVNDSNDVFVADCYNKSIRKISATGVVTTIAGSPGTLPRVSGPTGNKGPAGGVPGTSGMIDGSGTNAQFVGPQGIALDAAGNLYVSDSGYCVLDFTTNSITVQLANAIRKISPSGTNWIVTTITGTNYAHVNGSGTNAQVQNPFGLIVDSATNLYVAEHDGCTIRMLQPIIASGQTNVLVTTIAGQYMSGNNDGHGTNAQFSSPEGIALDANSNLYVADTGNNTIRKISPSGTNWIVTTIGGLAGNPGSVDGTGAVSLFNQPASLTVDFSGNVYVADTANNTIRKGVFTQQGTAPVLVVNAQGIGLSGTTNTTYRIETTTSLNNPTWTGLSTNTITSTGFNLVVPKPANPATIFYRAVWLNR